MKVLINGFGRIGRAITRINLQYHYFDIVAINDINPDIKNMAYLIKYDCTYGRLTCDVNCDERYIEIEGNKIYVTHERNIEDVDCTGIDIVIDASGIQNNIAQIKRMCETTTVKHFIFTNINAADTLDIIFGVNEERLKTDNSRLLSSSICDAVSLAPIYKIIDDNFKIESGFLTTLHPWLSYQNLLDGAAASWSQPGDVFSHYALGRASVQNLIPKSTSAVKAVARVIEDAEEKIESFSYRVPTSVVASAVLTVKLVKETSMEEVLDRICEYERLQKYHIIRTTAEPLISADYTGDDYSAIIDTRWIKVKNKSHLEIVYWYDNEWGYSSRIVDIIRYLTAIEDNESEK